MSARATEDQLIARYFAPLAGPGGLELADDAALLTPPAGCDLVLTKDALVAGAHFFADDPAELIARKALRVNLSDLAAKGARPLGFLLGLALPRDWREDWLAAFAHGLGEDARSYGCPLLGGDTVATSGPLTLSITAIGAVPAGRMTRRGAARAGDILFVSGTIGDGALGLLARGGELDWLARDARAYLTDRYLSPQPRLALAPVLQAYARAAMDISDGFVGDLIKMARASKVGARARVDAAPLSWAARAAISRRPDLFQRALTGGDDYEILAAVAPENAAAFTRGAAAAGAGVAEVGRVVAGSDVVFEDAAGEGADFAQTSFQHF